MDGGERGVGGAGGVRVGYGIAAVRRNAIRLRRRSSKLYVEIALLWIGAALAYAVRGWFRVPDR